MIKDILRFYSKLFVFASIVALVHYTLHYFDLWVLNARDFKRIHGFNFLASVFLYPVLAYSFHYLKDKAGFVFLALSLFKMLMVMIFMAILILPNTEPMQSFALQFLIVYSFYLIFELLITVRNLKD